MNTTHFITSVRSIVAGVAMALAGALPAQGADPALIARLVDGALPKAITGENSILIGLLLTPKLDAPLSKSFSLATAIKTFPRGQTPILAGDCKRQTLEGECVASYGTPDGAGAYTQLSFNTNLGLGNVSLFKRAPVNDKITLADLKPVTLEDPKALDQAMAFLKNNFGLPNEVPMPPAGVANPYVVGQAIDISDSKSTQTSGIIRKIVSLPRGLEISKPIDIDGQHSLSFIPAPGSAMVVFDSTGIIGANIENWQDLRIDPKMDPRNAKSRQNLIDEITEDLTNDGGDTIGKLAAQIVYIADWRGTFGYLLPAVQLSVVPVPGALNPEQLTQLYKDQTPITPFVRTYELVNRQEGAVTGR